MTKEQAKQVATKHGCEAEYSGAEKILHVHGDNAKKAAAEIKAGKPIFKVKVG